MKCGFLFLLMIAAMAAQPVPERRAPVAKPQ